MKQILIDGISTFIHEAHSIKLSDFILALQSILEEHGDVEVFEGGDWKDYSIETEFFEVKDATTKIENEIPEATEYPRRLVI